MLLPNDPEILLVEDNLVVVDSVIRMLSKLGYNKVESVSDYNAAVQILSLKKIHLVLIDILLSGKETGIELGGHIRENKNIPFIFITSNSDRVTVAEAKKVTPNGYLVKPFDREDLFTAIEIALFNFRSNCQLQKRVLSWIQILIQQPYFLTVFSSKNSIFTIEYPFLKSYILKQIMFI